MCNHGKNMYNIQLLNAYFLLHFLIFGNITLGVCPLKVMVYPNRSNDLFTGLTLCNF